MYRINKDGDCRLKYVNNDVIKGLIIEPFVFVFISLLVYLSVYPKSSLGFFAILAYIMFMFIFSLLAKLRWVKKHNRTISKIDFQNEEVIIKTEKIIWLKAKEYKIKKAYIHFENRKFKWYGKKSEKEGLLIIVNGVDLFLVKDYFDEFQEIKNLLAK